MYSKLHVNCALCSMRCAVRRRLRHCRSVDVKTTGYRTHDRFLLIILQNMQCRAYYIIQLYMTKSFFDLRVTFLKDILKRYINSLPAGKSLSDSDTGIIGCKTVITLVCKRLRSPTL
jgi:hypothetical protein